MRAAILEQANQPLKVYDDVEIIEPRVGEVRVNVKYCGLCHSDLGFVDGKMPLGGQIILGHEASGIVESIGPGVTNLEPGDHVILTPAPPCGKCYYCQRHEHSLCVDAMGIMTNALADGTTGLSRQNETVLRGCGVGGLAEYVITTATGAIKIDKDIPLDVVCVIGCALQTGVGAVLNTAKVEQGATVVIMGLGGVGMATVQGARIAGATTIIVSDPVAERREAAKAFGATHTIDPTTEDLAALCMELTGGIGMDYAFETAGKAVLIEQGINLTRMGGTTVCVGSPALEEGISIPHVVLFTATEKKLCGCLLGSSNSLYEIPRLIRLWKQGLLELDAMVTSRRPLSEINEGFDDLANSRGIRTVIEI
jgi:Zn-dependent alcohol dehydrogenase